MRVLVVDNYDSFAYNLVQYVGEVVTGVARPDGPTGGEVVVRRNDAVDLADVDDLDPDAVVVSPGPGTPAEAGISIPLFAERSYPTLGVCLGHQALCAANGADVGHAPTVVHGKPSTVRHDGEGIFRGVPSPIEVGRYHSLAVDPDELPGSLVETAHTVEEGGTGGQDGARGQDGAGDQDGDRNGYPEDEAGADRVVMGVRHRDRPHVGVQFHPESVLTDAGLDLVATFLADAVPDGSRPDRSTPGGSTPGGSAFDGSTSGRSTTR